jgi:hypothetical protein
MDDLLLEFPVAIKKPQPVYSRPVGGGGSVRQKVFWF